MFDIFRKHTKIMMAVLFLLIIPSFVLFGIDGYNRMRESDTAVARVSGHEITQAQWDLAHKNEADRVRASSPNVDTKLLDSPAARYVTLERLVRDKVISLAAEKTKLVTSDARLARYLQEDPNIASLRTANGKIDMERYRQLAANQGFTPEGFENSVRQDLSKQQVEAALQSSSFATPAVADVALNAFFERREIQLASFQAADYSIKVSPTDAELEAYYKANLGQFQASEQAKVEYVVLDMDAVKRGIQISEVDLKAFYDQNAEQLSGKEERRASHILITAPKEAAAKEREAARAKAQQLLQLVKNAPASFAEIAKKNSQDPGSAAKGGDLDFFARGAMVKPFEDTVFAMKKGDISDLVESDFGYHIILLTDIKSPKLRSFEELRPGIESDLKAQQAQRKYAEVAEVFTNTVYEQSESLKPVAEKLKLDLKTEEGLSRRALPGSKGPLTSDKFLSALFTPEMIEKKRNTEAIEIGVNQLVAGRILSYEPARAMPLEEVRQKLRDRVIAIKSAEMARKEGSEKLAQWKTAEPSMGLAAPVVVSRDQTQNLSPSLVSAVLRASATVLPVWVGVDLGDKGYTVVRVSKVLPPSEVAQAGAQQNRNQYAQWWNTAESLAYYNALKEKFKAEILVTDPGKLVIAKP